MSNPNRREAKMPLAVFRATIKAPNWPDATPRPSSKLLISAARRLIDVRFSLVRVLLLRLQLTRGIRVGRRLTGRVGLLAGRRSRRHSVLASVLRKLLKAIIDLLAEIVVHVL